MQKKKLIDYVKAGELAAQGKTLKEAAPFLRIPYATLCLKIGLSAARALVPDKIPPKKFGDPEYEEMVRNKHIKSLRHRVEAVIAAGEILFHRIVAAAQISPDDVADTITELKLDKKIIEIQKGSFTTYFLTGFELKGEWSILNGRVFAHKSRGDLKSVKSAI